MKNFVFLTKKHVFHAFLTKNMFVLICGHEFTQKFTFKLVKCCFLTKNMFFNVFHSFLLVKNIKKHEKHAF